MCPGQGRHGIVHKDQPVLCRERIRHAGDPVALVLAESPAALRAALAAMRAELAPLPGVFDPRPPSSAARRWCTRPQDGNLLMHAVIKKGDARKELKAAPVSVRGEFFSPVQEHAFLETQWRHGEAIARRRPGDGFEHPVAFPTTVSRSARPLGWTPCPSASARRTWAAASAARTAPRLQCLLAVAALYAGGKPVRMAWSREESMLAGFKRHATRMSCALGALEDGTLTAFTCEMLYDTGAYAHLGGEVMELSMEHACGPYRVPSLRVEGRCVYTNTPIAGAFRGFGVVQASPAFEGLMDELAAKLGMDPLELRRKNALRSGDENGCGVRVGSAELPACLDALAAHPLWTGREQWRKEAPAFTRRGVGLLRCSTAWATAGVCRTWP
jgi:CO/xanthine dehydrogenase Mo-binding subunit